MNDWPGSKLIIKFLSFSLFLVFVLIFFYIGYISPLSGDAWGYFVTSSLGNASLLDIAESYWRGYLGGNPRIGQIPMNLAGYGQFSSALIGIVSFMLLFCAGFYVVTGKFFRPDSILDIGALAVFVASTTFVGVEIGKSFFYSPFVTNYMFGFALLMTFLAICRLGFEGNHAKSILLLISTIFLGFFSGLSNEHTVPYFLGIGLLSFVYLFYRRSEKVGYALVAYTSLFLGYIALYFSPGQNQRYQNVKNTGFEALFDDFQGRFLDITDLLFSGFWQLIPVMFIVLVYFAFFTKHDRNFLSVLILFGSVFGMAYVVMASPKLGQRLMFAPYCAIGFCYVWMYYKLEKYRLLYVGIGMISLIFSIGFIYTALLTYSEYHQAYQGQVRKIEALKWMGQKNIRLKPLDFDFRQHREFVYNEYFSDDPAHRINKLRAKVFGVESLAYDKL